MVNVKGRFDFLVSMYSKKGLKDYRHTHHLGKAYGFIRLDTNFGHPRTTLIIKLLFPEICIVINRQICFCLCLSTTETES